MNYNLFLDDIREPYIDPKYIAALGKKNFDFVSTYHYTNYAPFKNEEWVIVRSHDEFVKKVEELGVPKIVAFDHDLGDEHYKNTTIINYSDFKEKTGYDSAKWLCDYCLDNNVKFPEYYVHSWNPTGKQNIITYIENYKKHIEND
jgi:hypothetical protein